MPYSYTHAYIAHRALTRSGHIAASNPAFLAGVNGPDALFAFAYRRQTPKPNLPALAQRMHTEQTGAFLQQLVLLAVTPVQQSYVLGYATHCAADALLNPYIQAMSQSGKPYGQKQGKLCMEAALDATLYYKDYRTYLVPVAAGAPALLAEELAQVTGLLRAAVLQVYRADIPPVALADTYHDNYRYKKLLYSRFGAKKALVSLLALFVPARNRGSLKAAMQPAKPLKSLPSGWVNPYTRQAQNQTLEELLQQAQEAAGVYITTIVQYWLGQVGAAHLAKVLQGRNLYTGLADTPVHTGAQNEGATGQQAPGGQPGALPKAPVEAPKAAVGVRQNDAPFAQHAGQAPTKGAAGQLFPTGSGPAVQPPVPIPPHTMDTTARGPAAALSSGALRHAGTPVFQTAAVGQAPHPAGARNEAGQVPPQTHNGPAAPPLQTPPGATVPPEILAKQVRPPLVASTAGVPPRPVQRPKVHLPQQNEPAGAQPPAPARSAAPNVAQTPGPVAREKGPVYRAQPRNHS